MWRQVSNLPIRPGKLQTCRHLELHPPAADAQVALHFRNGFWYSPVQIRVLWGADGLQDAGRARDPAHGDKEVGGVAQIRTRRDRLLSLAEPIMHGDGRRDLTQQPLGDGARADPYKWCAVYAGGGESGGSTSCYFVTIEQCRAAVSGVGGFCAENGFYDGKPVVTPEDRVPVQRARRPR